MHGIPSLPTAGPLRLLAISASLSLLAFCASTAVLLQRRRPRPAGWAAAPFATFVLSFGLGRLAPALHPLAAAATFVLALRNAIRLEGLPRLLQAAGLLTWAIAMLAAQALFRR